MDCPRWLRAAIAFAGGVGLVASCGGSADHARIVVDHPIALTDTPVAIRVEGLHGGQRLTLRASRRDRAGTRWSSQATFAADSGGVVDVRRASPIRGSYRGMHAMGLLWSMLPSQGRRQGVLFEPPPGRSAVNLTAMADGHLIARQRIVRETLAPGVQVTHLRPRTSGLYGSLYTRPAQRRGAAVLVLGGSGGGLDLAGGIARMLASHGFPAFALAYFREPGLPHELKEVPLEYFAHALRRLAHTPGIDPRRIAVVGISRGSEAAQLLGVHYPRLVHAVVGYVPSSVVNPGLRSADGPWLHTSAWSLHGRPIPYVRRRWLHVPNPTSDPQAMIPDERILGPILLISAEQDNVWPSSGYAKAIIARLDAHRFRFFHRALDYAAAGHAVGVGVPNLSLDCAYDICPLGGTTVGNATSRADSWRGLLDFLEAFGAGKPRF